MNRTNQTFVFAIFMLLTGLNALAQQQCYDGQACEPDSFYNGACLPLLSPTATGCHSNGAIEEICSVRNNKCPAVPENTCPAAPAIPQQAGCPIALATGDTYISQTDLRIPGIGGGLSVTRTWHSIWSPLESAYRVGMFGPNWRSTYEERIFAGSDGYVKYSRGDGSFWSFGYTGTASDGIGSTYGVASPANDTAILTQGLTNWTLVFKSGEKRVFDSVSGNLLSITDRNGNVTQLTYDASNRLVTVTDPGGRHLYFTYPSTISYFVTGVSSDVGVSLTYSYDNQGRLNKVTKPDQTTLSFQYDSNSLITTVLDTSGKILESHTYDANGRGLTSARAGGVESLTVSYP